MKAMHYVSEKSIKKQRILFIVPWSVSFASSMTDTNTKSTFLARISQKNLIFEEKLNRERDAIEVLIDNLQRVHEELYKLVSQNLPVKFQDGDLS